MLKKLKRKKKDHSALVFNGKVYEDLFKDVIAIYNDLIDNLSDRRYPVDDVMKEPIDTNSITKKVK